MLRIVTVAFFAIVLRTTRLRLVLRFQSFVGFLPLCFIVERCRHLLLRALQLAPRAV